MIHYRGNNGRNAMKRIGVYQLVKTYEIMKGIENTC